MENKKPERRGINKWMSLINIPFQMGLIIFVFFKSGEWLDVHYPNSAIYYSQLLTLLGVGVALYQVIKQVNKIGNK